MSSSAAPHSHLLTSMLAYVNQRGRARIQRPRQRAAPKAAAAATNKTVVAPATDNAGRVLQAGSIVALRTPNFKDLNGKEAKVVRFDTKLGRYTVELVTEAVTWKGKPQRQFGVMPQQIELRGFEVDGQQVRL